MIEVTLETAADRRETVENLFQLYVHDFTAFWETRRVDLAEDGRFPPYPPLAAYWTDETGEPFLIRVNGALAGFALINGHSHSGRPCDFNMGEFFVARHYRRQGVGRIAARRAISPRPGLWEIAVSRRNVPALLFWRAVAAELTARDVAEHDQNDERWNGMVLRFPVAFGTPGS